MHASAAGGCYPRSNWSGDRPIRRNGRVSRAITRLEPGRTWLIDGSAGIDHTNIVVAEDIGVRAHCCSREPFADRSGCAHTNRSFRRIDTSPVVIKGAWRWSDSTYRAKLLIELAAVDSDQRIGMRQATVRR